MRKASAYEFNSPYRPFKPGANAGLQNSIATFEQRLNAQPPETMKNKSSLNPKLEGGRQKSAFTLTELLVIIAVIAFGAASLLPALARTKYPSLLAYCTSNYHQWNVMANVYANDAQGILPSWELVRTRRRLCRPYSARPMRRPITRS
jgi:hypothetical protein